MNAIYKSQGSDSNEILLMAQAYLYYRVKFYGIVNFFLSIIFPIILSVATFVLNKNNFLTKEVVAPYLACYGILVLIINLTLSGYVSNERRKAAVIQEMYDCNVLKIQWNELKVGKELSRDNVYRAASYFIKRPNKIKNRWVKMAGI